jgi:predicted dehydrogenase
MKPNKPKEKKSENLSSKGRRRFVKHTAIGTAGFMIVPRYVLGGPGFTAPSDQVRIATIGSGGKGHSDTLRAVGHKEDDPKKDLERITALCDVDFKNASKLFKTYDKTPKYKDFRKMLDKHHKQIDAVIISTPDHTHAVAAMAAMKMSKHVYVQKPLTHDVFEARMLTEAAKEYNVVTQMGNQGSSGDDIRRICEWIWAGTIGDVREVHCWTNRPVWEQGMTRPAVPESIPADLDWDLWLGTAPERPYHSAYHPFSWRGWWDFGTGALGDMACHIMDPAVRALKLKYPDEVQAFAPFKRVSWARVHSLESPPVATTVHYHFPARDGMPPVKLTWYDGGLMPPRPEELEDDEPMGNFDGGVLFVGDKGKMMCDCYGQKPRLLPSSRQAAFTEPNKTIPRIKADNHQRNWIDSIKGEDTPSSDFDYAGPFTEIVLMGNLAIRSLYIQEEVMRNGKAQMSYTGEGKKLKWDGQNMRITNYEPANQFVRREYRGSWGL